LIADEFEPGVSARSGRANTDAVRRRYFWARRPEIAGDVVCRVPRCLAAYRTGTPLVAFPVTQKAPPCLGKGLDLRKLVAGAGF